MIHLSICIIHINIYVLPSAVANLNNKSTRRTNTEMKTRAIIIVVFTLQNFTPSPFGIQLYKTSCFR